MARYSVDQVRDDTGLLRDRLQEIADGGGKVVSVIWQPTRQVLMGDNETNPLSGYVVVSEYD
jgi:hypothetical protein